MDLPNGRDYLARRPEPAQSRPLVVEPGNFTARETVGSIVDAVVALVTWPDADLDRVVERLRAIDRAMPRKVKR
jgi:hypothetical protein